MISDFFKTANSYLHLSFSLVIFSGILFLWMPSIPRSLKLLAMFICFLADLALANYKPFTNLMGGYGFEKGALLFMLAHFIYFTAFALLLRTTAQPIINKGFWYGCLVTIIATTILLYFYAHNPVKDIKLLIFCIIYALVIGLLCITICSYASSQKGWAILNAIGIISFIISDLFIGISTLGGVTIPYYIHIVWFFYPIGQFLMLL